MGFWTGHTWAGRVSSCYAEAVLLGAVLLAGCASPGQPKPPSLQLPQVVGDLSAERVGERVRLRWTNPSETTDRLAVRGAMVAVVCRQVLSLSAGRPGCVEVARLQTKPGPAGVEDSLPSELRSSAGVLLAYRVEVLNEAGRGAGRSAQTFVAGGAAPTVPREFRAAAIRGGIRLEWSPAPADGVVEVDRVDLSPAPQGSRAGRAGLPGAAPVSGEVHLRSVEAAGVEAGGMVDRTVRKGASYRYTAERVETVEMEKRGLVLRSGSSAPVTVTVLSRFPPQPPAGLEASPAGANAIDLSWRPGTESDLAGYNVFRLNVAGGAAEAWKRLNEAPVAVPGYEDTDVRAGGRYRYRVTAVDADGNESVPGGEVEETAVQP